MSGTELLLLIVERRVSHLLTPLNEIPHPRAPKFPTC